GHATPPDQAAVHHTPAPVLRAVQDEPLLARLKQFAFAHFAHGVILAPAVFVAGVAFVVLLTSCSTSPGSHGPATGSPPASASGTSPTRALPAPVGRAPTIRIVGNHFVDGHGDKIRLLGVNFAGVEGACVDPGFQQGATDQHPGKFINSY